MFVFQPISLLADFDQKTLCFAFEDFLDYKDDEVVNDPDSKDEICSFSLPRTSLPSPPLNFNQRMQTSVCST